MDSFCSLLQPIREAYKYNRLTVAEKYINYNKKSIIHEFDNNLESFITELKYIMNIKHFLKCLDLSFWDLLFNYVIFNMNSYLTPTNILDTLSYIIIHNKNIISDFSIKDYLKECKLYCLTCINQYNIYLETKWCKQTSKIIRRLLNQFIENCCCLDIWKTHIKYIIEHNIKQIPYLYKNYRWIFYNIPKESIINSLKNTLDNRVEHYYYNNDDTTINKGHQQFSLNFVKALHIFHDILKSIPYYINFLEEYIHKIVVLHGNTSLLTKIYKLNKLLFLVEDNYGYMPFIDCLRYGDHECIKWFNTHILTDLDTTYSVLENAIANNNGFQYAFTNNNKHILKTLFEIISEKLDDYHKSNIIRNLFTLNLQMEYPKYFKYKIRLCLKFVINNNNLTKNIIYDFLHWENYVQNNYNLNNLVVIDYIYDYCLSKKIQLNLSLNWIKLSGKYTSKEYISKIIYLCDIDTFTLKNIENYVFDNVLPFNCLCHSEKILKILLTISLSSSESLSSKISILSKSSLSEIFSKFFNTQLKDKFSQGNNDKCLISLYKNSIRCKCYKSSFIEDEIINIFKIRYNKTMFYNIGKLNYKDTKNTDVEFVSLHFDFIKKLYLNNFFHYNLDFSDGKIWDSWTAGSFNIKNYYSYNLDLYQQHSKGLKQTLVKNRNMYEKYILIDYLLCNLKQKHESNKKSNIKNTLYIIPKKDLDNILFIDKQNLENIYKRWYLCIYDSINFNNIKNVKQLNSALKYNEENINFTKKIIELTKLQLGMLYIYKNIVNRTKIKFNTHYDKFSHSIKQLKSIDSNTIFSKIDIEERLMLTLDNINKNYTITTPDNADFVDLITNYKTHSVLTEKIDGVTQRNIRIKNSFPSIPILSKLTTEFLEEDNIHFIIGMTTPDYSIDLNFIDTIEYLRNEHPYTSSNSIINVLSLDTIISCYSVFKAFVKTEKENYKRYCELHKEKEYQNSVFWWPKKYFILNYNNFDEYIRLIGIIQSLSDTTNNLNNLFNIFKNDGIIIQHKEYSHDDDINSNHKLAFKLKPHKLMTIDLFYSNGSMFCDKMIKYNYTEIDFEAGLRDNTIYRCYPIFDSNNRLLYFKPKDIRTDKKSANTKDIIVKILRILDNGDYLNSIMDYINLSKSSYYSKINYSKMKHNRFKLSDYKETYKCIGDTIIDFGGGYKTQKYLRELELDINRCFVTDNDLNIIINQLGNNTNSSYNYGFLDFNKPIDNYNNVEKMLFNESEFMLNKFNTILAINCINYSLHKFDVFMTYLNSCSESGTKLIIRFMDSELFSNCINSRKNEDSNNQDSDNQNSNNQDSIVIKSPYDSSYINYNKKQNTNRLYFEWTHQEPIDEKIIGRTELNHLFDKHGWKEILYETNKFNSCNNNKQQSYISNDNENDTELWNLYFQSFVCITFERQ